MHTLTKLILDDMKPALGVTEPGAIAYAVSTAMTYVPGKVQRISLHLNSGIYKNAYTCGIPGSSHLGNVYAAALGAVAADPGKGLECLDGVGEEDNRKAEALVEEGRIQVHMTEITSRIFIRAEAETETGKASVTIRDSHTNIVEILVNDKVQYRKGDEPDSLQPNSLQPDRDGDQSGAAGTAESGCPAEIHRWTVEQLLEYVRETDYEELKDLMKAHEMNYELFLEGIRNPRMTFGPYLLESGGGEIFSQDAGKTAALLCAAAIEARVMGLDLPAMSITGSGAHGILATLPLYAEAKVRGLSEEALVRATALSYLICIYIKEYSGKLSAFCGCGIAAGTGAACGLVYLRGGGLRDLSRCINNMASGITGMICDGGNKGCVMKGITAADSAFRAADLALHGISVEGVHGINGSTPEETMRHMGLIASPGMEATEGTIVSIMRTK